MITGSHLYRNKGDEFRKQNDIDLAGDYYNAAANGYLASMQYSPSMLEKGHAPDYLRLRYLTHSVRNRLFSILCRRFEDEHSHARAVARQGVAVIEELVNHHPSVTESAGRRGLCHELEGDLRYVADLGDHEQAYDAALDCYDQVPDGDKWIPEPEFTSAIDYVEDLMIAAGLTPDSRRFKKAHMDELPIRVDMKRDEFRTAIEELTAEDFADYGR